MSHRRLTDLTAVLAGTAVFFTILTASGTKKAAQAVSGTVRTAAVVCAGAVCYDEPQALSAQDFCDFDGSDAVTQGAVLSFTGLVELSVNGLQEGTGKGSSNYQVLESALSFVARFTQRERYADTLFRLTLPPGVYEVDGQGEPLHLYQNTWLSMQGVTLRKSDSDCSALLRNTPSGSAYAGCEGNSNLVLTGGVWEVPLEHFDARSEEDRFSVLRFGHCRNVLLAGVTVSGCVNGHHLELCGVENCSVVNSTFQGYLDTEYHGKGDKKEAIQLDVVNNRWVAPGFPDFDDTITRDVLIYDCTFRNLCRGIGGHNAVYGRSYTNIAIQRNTFTHLSGDGVYALNYVHADISHNKMKQVAGGVTLLALTDHPDDAYYAPAQGDLPAFDRLPVQSHHLSVTDNQITVTDDSEPAITISGGVYGDAQFADAYGGRTFWVEDVTLARNQVMGRRIVQSYVRD